MQRRLAISLLYDWKQALVEMHIRIILAHISMLPGNETWNTPSRHFFFNGQICCKSPRVLCFKKRWLENLELGLFRFSRSRLFITRILQLRIFNSGYFCLTTWWPWREKQRNQCFFLKNDRGRLVLKMFRHQCILFRRIGLGWTQCKRKRNHSASQFGIIAVFVQRALQSDGPWLDAKSERESKKEFLSISEVTWVVVPRGEGCVCVEGMRRLGTLHICTNHDGYRYLIHYQ